MIFRVRTVCGIYPHTVIHFPGFTLKFCPVYGVQFRYFLRQPLTKDPQQVWQTLKNFDYPKDVSLGKHLFYDLRFYYLFEFYYVFFLMFTTFSILQKKHGFKPFSDYNTFIVFCNFYSLM